MSDVRWGVCALQVHKSTLFVIAVTATLCTMMTYMFLETHIYRNIAAEGNILKPIIRNDSHHKYPVKPVNTVRILCVILTMEKDIATKVKAVNDTWVTRCDKYFYIITSSIKHPDFLNIDVPDTRKNLVHKIRKVYEVIYKRYINDFDWIYKCDDDTFAVIENLRFLLSHYKSTLPGYIGYHFNKFIQNGYMSGGAGYAFSNKALRLLVENGYQKNLCPVVPNPDDPENSEDIETGKCLQAVGVPVLSSLDAAGRETFHPYPPEKHLFGPLPDYVHAWSMNPVQVGENCCSPFVISFHYMSTESIYLLNHFLYKTRIYGIHSDVEADVPKNSTGEAIKAPAS